MKKKSTPHAMCPSRNSLKNWHDTQNRHLSGVNIKSTHTAEAEHRLSADRAESGKSTKQRSVFCVGALCHYFQRT